MKELGSKYGAAGAMNQSPNLHEIMAAQSGWSGQRQTANFASPQIAEGRHSHISVPKAGAKVAMLGDSTADSEKPGDPVLSAQGCCDCHIVINGATVLVPATYCDL